MKIYNFKKYIQFNKLRKCNIITFYNINKICAKSEY